jgi:MFS family permease
MRQLTRNLMSPDLPGQFRLMVAGSLLTSTGHTMSFPFLTLYLNTQLGIPLDRVGLLFVFHAVAGLVAQIAAGPLADRIGRKPVMMVGLFATGLFALGYTRAETFEEFLLLATLTGFFGSVYYPASSAMVIDLVGAERRAEAFGLTRVAVNLGWVIGPSLGGLMATQSYTMLFVATAVAEFAYVLVLALFARETLPRRTSVGWDSGLGSGYGGILRDRLFLVFLGASVLTTTVAMQMTTTMPVFLKQEGVPESGYGLLMALNAGLVVLFQIPTTRMVAKRNRVWMLSLGAFLYAVGFGSLGWWHVVPLFALSMVILTVGEMVIVPVSAALVADLAPPEARARYTSLFSLTWTMGMGIGPAAGGLVMEHLGSAWLWHACLVTGCLSALAYLPLSRMVRTRADSQPERVTPREAQREAANTPLS